MGKKYRITLPMSKEQFLHLINQTTKDLTIQNQVESVLNGKIEVMDD